jgi:sugar phosphate isomerase/epimerase
MKIKLILVCLLIHFSCFAQIKSPVGVQLYSFREQFAKDVRGTFQKVKDMGLSKVEVAGFYNLSVQEYKNLLSEYGMVAEAVGASFEELQDVAKLKNIIENAKLLGAKNIICYWIPHQEHDFNFQDIQKSVKVFNEAGKTIAANGLSFLYHNHGYEFVPYKDHYLMDELIKLTNPAYVNFEMDILWVYHPGHNPVTWLKKYPSRWKAIHLKDRRKGTDGNQNGRMDIENDVVLGSGDLNMDDILKQIIALKIKYLYIEDESPRPIEQVPQSITFLQSYFK